MVGENRTLKKTMIKSLVIELKGIDKDVMAGAVCKEVESGYQLTHYHERGRVWREIARSKLASSPGPQMDRRYSAICRVVSNGGRGKKLKERSKAWFVELDFPNCKPNTETTVSYRV